ncbi:hypothetical protein KKF91_20355 [Myxococcota bacterium]|nr:hypothetical protein [Myxococcota bacterium]MBU1432899.1 hypothetical protein [Myxococcota bacterium]MBU1900139.1 hypothetical protein [Myxococcota bacterium]
MRWVSPLLLLALACGPLEKPQEDNIAPHGPDDPKVVRLAFLDLVKAAQAQDQEAIIGGLEAYLATREEIRALFGPEVGEHVWRGYNDTIAARLRKEAAEVISARVSEGYTEVTLRQVGPAYPAHTTPGDQIMLDALASKRAMFSVHLHRPGETLGLRFNGFVWINGRWRALLKSYDFIEAR